MHKLVYVFYMSIYVFHKYIFCFHWLGRRILGNCVSVFTSKQCFPTWVRSGPGVWWASIMRSVGIRISIFTHTYVICMSLSLVSSRDWVMYTHAVYFVLSPLYFLLHILHLLRNHHAVFCRPRWINSIMPRAQALCHPIPCAHSKANSY